MSGIDGKSVGGQLSDFLAIASVLADPSKVAEEYQKIEKARAEAQAIIDLVGPANEILSMREEADKLYNAAQTALDDAQSFSKKTTFNAEVKAADIVAMAQEKAAEIVAAAEKRMQDVIFAQENADKVCREAEASKVELESKFRSMSEEYNLLAEAAKRAVDDANATMDKAQSMKAKFQTVASQLAETLNEVAKD